MNRPAATLSPRAARTRSALLEAGFELLADRPVDAIAIDEVVAAAGVAKGSFFNHFVDKRGFAIAVAAEIRATIEARVAQFNRDTADPLVRLAGGMIVAAAFALSDPRRTAILARTAQGMMIAENPLNKGVLEDLGAWAGIHDIPPEAARSGLAFWLGCCQTVMSMIVERRGAIAEAGELLTDMLALGLRGLGARDQQVASIADPLSVRAKLEKALATG